MAVQAAVLNPAVPLPCALARMHVDLPALAMMLGAFHQRQHKHVACGLRHKGWAQQDYWRRLQRLLVC